MFVLFSLGQPYSIISTSWRPAIQLIYTTKIYCLKSMAHKSVYVLESPRELKKCILMPRLIPDKSHQTIWGLGSWPLIFKVKQSEEKQNKIKCLQRL